MNPISKNLIAFCFTLLWIASLYCQNIKRDTLIRSTQPPPLYCPSIPPPDSMMLYNTSEVQVPPQFPGDIKKYLADSIRYPDDARKKNIQGFVILNFIVEKSGSVSTI